MRPLRPFNPTCARLAAAAVLACLPAAGCSAFGHTRLWADTALPDGTLSIQRHQWAYDGEPVTFELQCDRGAADYVVFGCAGDETVVNTAQVEGRYRWTRAFAAGPRPQTYEVYATPFKIHGRCDYVYDTTRDTWSFYPGGSEKPDIQTAPEQVMKITCYRVEIHLKFKARAGEGRPTRVALGLTSATGERKNIPPRPPGEPDKPGFLLLGPDRDGMFEVVYAPTFREIGRAGKTDAELLVEHADGSVERLADPVDTP